MKGKPVRYSDAELTWIQAHSSKPRAEILTAFRDRFNRPEISLSNINSLCNRMGWKSKSSGRFAKGNVPFNKGKGMSDETRAKVCGAWFKKGSRTGRANVNYKPVGTERVSRDGYVERKINEDRPFYKRWRAVHLINWEAENGPLLEGHALKCLDGNRQNTAAENWQAVPRAYLPRLVGGRWGRLPYDSASPEVRPTLLAIAKLEHAAREASK